MWVMCETEEEGVYGERGGGREGGREDSLTWTTVPRMNMARKTKETRRLRMSMISFRVSVLCACVFRGSVWQL